MSFTIDPTMDFHEVVSYYGMYITAVKADGKKPVSFMRFITGRF